MSEDEERRRLQNDLDELNGSLLRGKTVRELIAQLYHTRLSTWQEWAAREEPIAQFLLGYCYLFGFGVQEDFEEVLKWHRKAANSNLANAQVEMGHFYRMTKDVHFEEGIPLYCRAVDQGLAEAGYWLGVCLEKGYGVSKDLHDAVGCYRWAADRGDVKAQTRLGWCYLNGLGIDKDGIEAVKLFERAANNGYAAAQYYLGQCYDNGEGVSKSFAQAASWYRKAAIQGDADAQFYLGRCYQTGEGVSKRSWKEAAKWYRKAAEQGLSEACHCLARCYERGRGVPKDGEQARYWYERAFSSPELREQYFGGK